MGYFKEFERANPIRVFLARDARTYQHVLVWALERPIDEMRYEEVLPAVLSDLLRATALDEILDVIDSELSPLFHEEKVAGVWGGRVYRSVEDFANERLPELLPPDSNTLRAQIIVQPRVSQSPKDPLVFGPRIYASSTARAISERSLENAWFLDDDCGGEEAVSCVVVEPLAEWLTVKNLLAICGSLHVYLRDGSLSAGKGEPIWSGFDMIPFEAREADDLFTLRSYVTPLCVIAPPYEPSEIPRERRKRVRLSDVSPFLANAFRKLAATGTGGNAWYARLKFDDQVGVVVLRRSLEGILGGDIYYINLVVESALIGNDRMSFSKVINDIGMSFTIGPDGDWGWEWSFAKGESEGKGDAIMKPANLMGALWTTLLRHPGYELTVCAHCKKTVLLSSRGAKSKYCSSSCRVAASKERAKKSKDIKEKRNQKKVEMFQRGFYEGYSELAGIEVASMVDKVLSGGRDDQGAQSKRTLAEARPTAKEGGEGKHPSRSDMRAS